jgi:hypothetical protein
MTSHIHYFDVKDRLDEARAAAARERLILLASPKREPLRVLVGLAMIKAGRWLARTAPRRAAQPGRAAV